jgi:hypothetical protein
MVVFEGSGISSTGATAFFKASRWEGVIRESDLKTLWSMAQEISVSAKDLDLNLSSSRHFW